MKAITYTQYGDPDILQMKEIEKPTPKDNEVLVRVKAASVNSYDWDLVRGKPKIYRTFMGLRKPKNLIPGCDIAGIVEAIGNNVSNLKVGDEVFGDISQNGFGAFAEYACAPAEMLALKSKEITFEQAASIPQGGVLAIQGLRYNGKIEPGDEVLINGAGGSTGTFAIQIAKFHGAIITAVDSEDKLELLQSLGADFVIDYKKENYTKSGKKYDLIIDNMAFNCVFDYKRCLKPNGACAIVGGSILRIIQVAFLGGLISKFSNNKIGLMIHSPNSKDLHNIQQLIVDKRIKTVIGNTYPFEETTQALWDIGRGKTKGKGIIKIS